MLKTIKLWQLVAIGAIVLGGAGYGVYASVIQDDGDALSEDQQVIPVQLGDLINLVSTNGSLFYPNRVVLSFGSQGTIAEVLVGEGEAVEEGQALVTLDAATVGALGLAVDEARIALAAAEGALAAASAGYTALERAMAEASVAAATIALRDAEDAAATASGGPTAEDIARARLDADAAATALANAGSALSVTTKEGADDVEAAGDGLADATEGYRDVFDRWLGIALSADELGLDPSALLDLWEADLASIFDPAYVGDIADPSNEPTPDDPATRWNERAVYYVLAFFPGEIIASCDGVTVSPQSACVRGQMDAAADEYRGAELAWEAAQTNASKAVASAGAAVTKASDGLADAEDALADVLAGADPLEVAVAATELSVAQAKLAGAEAALAALLAGAPLALDLLQAQVETARLALELEILRLENSTLRAPMAGLTTFVGVAVGDTVNRTTPIVEIVDPTIVELDGVVDEIDVLFVQVGAAAEVTMDALPGRLLPATVSSIAAVGVNQQGVVSYPIRIRLEVPRGAGLREGLSATADIVIAREPNVALVPLQAILGSFDAPIVQVVGEGGGIEERAVVLGNNDEFWVAVREGLTEGERVVLQGAGASTQQLDFRQAFRQFGSFGGGGDRFQGGGGRGGGRGGGGSGGRTGGGGGG
ncbi:MAG: HlyD family efflux transporter periplasmic adaptor subunit [Chloroflexi bacterium]|nr:HlyD family efflux transporter periplasmic adaptor subunit [Chloroflexota bacterium]